MSSVWSVLQDEVKTINSKVYKESVRWLSALEGLIEAMQVRGGGE